MIEGIVKLLACVVGTLFAAIAVATILGLAVAFVASVV